MNKFTQLSIAFLSFTLAACGHANGADSADTSSQPALATPGTPATAVSALAYANQIRQQYGLQQMTTDPVLSAVAQVHAEDMLNRHYFDHGTPEGQSPFDRMTNAGLRYNNAAENIAMGVNTPAEVFQMWLNSPAHRRNLLNNVYGRQGIGYAGGYWVHDFAN